MVNESVMSIKDSKINWSLKVRKSESKINELDKVNKFDEKLMLVEMPNSLDQYNWQNSTEIQGILLSFSDDSLEDKL